MKHLYLYNSLAREKQLFTPIDPTNVKLYACGPTVYSYAHIGNARMAVVFDLLVRVLRHIYPRVTYVSNITDVDDKIMAASLETGEAINLITQKYERIYNEDLASLNVIAPDIQPRATDHIAEMIQICEQLITRGHAYSAEGHVLFHVPSFEQYGALSGRSRDDQIAGARVEIAPFKRDPADFVMWKPSSPDQVGWDSPWGRGRPGWHIECSAMAEKHLGLPFDIHGGGADLKFPHHENEIAQSCCAHGHANDVSAFAKVWVHNGFLTVAGEKMSKSLGNFLITHDLLKQGLKGEVIRYVLLSGHYRAPLDWSDDAVHAAQKNLDRFYATLHELRDVEVVQSAPSDAVLDALYDDLNTPKAYAELIALAGLARAQKTPILKAQLLSSLNLLGLGLQDPAAWLGYEENKDIDALIAERAEAKRSKNFKRSDEIRDQLLAEGIVIEDTPSGTIWRRNQ
jgi:cysteinyl-tRNA synthetase